MNDNTAVDFGRTARDYATHRAGLPDSFFKHLLALEVLQGRKKALDLGTGTGTMARGLAKHGFDVTGLDISDHLMAEARGLDEKAGVKVSYIKAAAETTGLAAQAFDVVTAVQCFHWFDKDKAAAEIRRVLKPGGLFIVAHFDWVEYPGNPVETMHILQRKYNPGWDDRPVIRRYPQKPGDLSFTGFTSKAYFLYEEAIPYTHIGWRGRMRAYGAIGGSLPKAEIEAFDAEFAAALQKQFREDIMRIPHKVWAEIWQV